jgi:hypothetical protein
MQHREVTCRSLLWRKWGGTYGTVWQLALGLRKEFQNTPPHLIGDVHATSATTVLTQTLATNVFKQYTTPFPLLFPNSGNICSFRESLPPFPKYYPSVWGGKNKSWTVPHHSLHKHTSLLRYFVQTKLEDGTDMCTVALKTKKCRKRNRVDRLMHQNWPTVIVISACTPLIAWTGIGHNDDVRDDWNIKYQMMQKFVCCSVQTWMQ